MVAATRCPGNRSAGERGIGHPELFALVDVRRPTLQVQQGRQGLADNPVISPSSPNLETPAADRGCPSRALFQPARPGSACQRPSTRLQGDQVEAAWVIPFLPGRSRAETCSNWNTMSTSRRAGSVNRRRRPMVTPGISPTVISDSGRPAKTCCVHFLQEFVDSRAAQKMRRSRRRTAAVQGRAVRQRGVLGNHVDDVHPETVDATIEPPPHHLVDGVAGRRGSPNSGRAAFTENRCR